MALDKIKFATNVPIECALKFPQGKLMDSQFGDPQYMFTTTDDRVFFVAEKVAAKIHGLRLQSREPFNITKAEVDYGNGRKGIEWQVAKVGFAPGEQPDGTFAVPVAKDAATTQMEADLLRSLADIRARQAAAGVAPPATVAVAAKAPQIPNGNGSSNGNGKPPAAAADPSARPLMPWALFLLSQTNMLIDVFALACKHASDNHGNAVKIEDVRSIMLSSFINVSKNGGGANVA